MNCITKSILIAIAAAVALGCGPTTVSAQTTIDLENRFPHVGAIMVWQVDDAGKPVELRGFASGTLIRDRVMVTAGHFTAPATTLGTLPPTIRLFASFNPTDARDPKTWIPVVRQATHPSMPPCLPSHIEGSGSAFRFCGVVVPYPTMVVCAPSDLSSEP